MSPHHGVLLTGATAQVGLHLLPALQEAGCSIHALSRQVPPAGHAAQTSGQGIRWFHPGKLRSLLDAGQQDALDMAKVLDTLVSAGPIALAIEWLPCLPGLRRVVCLSTSSIHSKAESADPTERQQIAGIIQAEGSLTEMCAARGIDLSILQPTMIYGCGMDQNLSRIASFIQRFGFVPLAGRAEGLRQPVHVADLAALMAQLCLAEWNGQHAWAVAGGSTLSYREMVVRVFQAVGKTPRPVSLPPGLLIAAVKVLARLGVMRGLNPAMIERQNLDLVFDDSEVRRRFSFQPRSFQPGPADFSLPPQLRSLLPPGLRPG